MSWWIGLNREELNILSQTREFKQLPKSYVVPKITDEGKQKLTEGEKKLRQIQAVKKYQKNNLKHDRCENCSIKTDINPKTGKNYRKCKYHREIKARWYQTYKRKR